LISKYHTFVGTFLGCNFSLGTSLDNFGISLCQLSCIVFTSQLVWEDHCARAGGGGISEGDTKFLYAMKLVPPKTFRKHCSSQYCSPKVPVLVIDKHVFAYNFFSITPHARTLEHALIFLENIVNEHVCMTLVSLSEKCNPH
jgi:hypothetical protein